MCGIVGMLGGGLDAGGAVSALNTACQAIRHRGPDDGGHFVDADSRVGFGHRRLSIQDLSPAGHQPMQSWDSRFVMVFNGEIYNHLDLRAELERVHGPVAWRGHSDTETLLAGAVVWGLEATLQRACGMFAIALWDRREQVLTLARDRLGEKPLYVGRAAGTILFASELAALRRWPGVEPRLDRAAVAAFMQRGWIPAPLSIWQGFAKLAPGHLLELRLADAQGADALPRSRAYWSLAAVAAKGLSARSGMNMDEATDALEAELGAAVRRQMISDVPLGAFLSGGIDSSTIVALMQAGSSRRVSTFSIGFHEAPYDEAPHAKAVAAHLGTDHTELYVSLDDARTVVPQLASIYSEPFADASQIPTALLCRLARRHVTVALSGDAGDELFGGYNRHAFADRWWPKLQRVPLPLRRWASRACLSIGQGQWDRAYGAATFLMRAERRTRLVGEKLHKLAGVVDSRDGGDLYELLMAPAPARGFTTGPQPESPRWRGSEVGGLSLPEQMMLVDGETYLPDDVLVKVDRAAMAASLETRVPFLDHHVVELAWRMPQPVKLHDGKGKKVLRHLLARYVPPALTERSKMGFSVPIGSWLRGPLREWAEVLLSPELLERGALLNPEPIRRLWHAHLSGQGDHPALLWNALMFQAWRQHWNLWE